jgi:AGZA family xanthine/uracil permease-like MFS transporter
LTGAILTYFGFMHGEAVGIGGGLGVTPGVALAYAVVAVGFLALARLATSSEGIVDQDMHLAAPAE